MGNRINLTDQNSWPAHLLPFFKSFYQGYLKASTTTGKTEPKGFRHVSFSEEPGEHRKTILSVSSIQRAALWQRGSPGRNETVDIMQAQGKDLQPFEDKIRREFAAMIVSLDDGVGQVMAALDKHKLADDTLLIFLSEYAP